MWEESPQGTAAPTLKSGKERKQVYESEQYENW
jgi:hypothetical protein